MLSFFLRSLIKGEIIKTADKSALDKEVVIETYLNK
jgi:hypothetical protein